MKTFNEYVFEKQMRILENSDVVITEGYRELKDSLLKYLKRLTVAGLLGGAVLGGGMYDRGKSQEFSANRENEIAQAKEDLSKYKSKFHAIQDQAFSRPSGSDTVSYSDREQLDMKMIYSMIDGAQQKLDDLEGHGRHGYAKNLRMPFSNQSRYDAWGY
jgi:hypothetical protein